MHITTEEYNFRMSDKEIKVILIILLVIIILGTTGLVMHIFNWWTVFWLMILNIGLGVKTKGAVTVAGAVFKAGGKKAIAVSAGGMLFKRHVIDLFGKFFAEHSVTRYKKNILDIMKIKFKEILTSTPIQRAKAVGSTLLTIPIVYLIWSKVITTGVQKLAYAIVYPIVAGIWTFLINTFGAMSNFFGFLFQVFALNWIITKLEQYTWGKKVIRVLDISISFLGDMMNYINKIFIWGGIDPKHIMIVYSIKFNRYLEKILDKGLNSHKKLKIRRDRHITAREALVYKREVYKNSKVKKENLIKKSKNIYRLKVKKNLTWQEKREKREKRKTI